MLQNKFEMPLDLTVKPSKIFYTYLIVVFLLSIVSVFISTSLSVIFQLLLFFTLVFSSFLILKKQCSNQVINLRLNKASEWELEINSKLYSEMTLSGECIVTHFLIWLNFSNNKGEGKNKVHHLLLFPDSADKDLLRQLRVRLRFLKESGVDKSVEY